MKESVVKNNQTEVAELANEITFQNYRWNRVDMHKLFQNMSSIDYSIVWILSRHMEGKEENKKLYLKEISEQLKLPIPKVSKLVQSLQDKGLVYWRHDGKGEEGTYIQITEAGGLAGTVHKSAFRVGNAFYDFFGFRFIVFHRSINQSCFVCFLIQFLHIFGWCIRHLDHFSEIVSRVNADVRGVS